MNWKDKIEKTASWIVIPKLIRYIAAAQFLVFILTKLVPEYLAYLTLDPSAILSGQLWRLISWIFVPQTVSYFWILFSILWLWFLGDFLEASWGTLRTNLFFLLGMIGGISAAFLIGHGGGIFNWYLNLSILFAFATLDPEHPVYFFFLPCKIKWLAWMSVCFLTYSFFLSSLLGKVAMLLSFANYLTFLLPIILKEAYHRRRRKSHQHLDQCITHLEHCLHCCCICNATEISAPDMDFRVSPFDAQEYCSRHFPSTPDCKKTPS